MIASPPCFDASRSATGSRALVFVHTIIDLRSSPDHPLGDAVDSFVRREDAERFVEDVLELKPIGRLHALAALLQIG